MRQLETPTWNLKRSPLPLDPDLGFNCRYINVYNSRARYGRGSTYYLPKGTVQMVTELYEGGTSRIYTCKLSAGIYFVTSGLLLREDFVPVAIRKDGVNLVNSELKNKSEIMFRNRLQEHEECHEMMSALYKTINLPRFKSIAELNQFLEVFKINYNAWKR